MGLSVGVARSLKRRDSVSVGQRRQAQCGVPGDAAIVAGIPTRPTPYGPKRKGGYLSVVRRNAYAFALITHRL